MSAEAIAEATRLYENAEAAHKGATTRLEAIRERIAGARTRQAEITALRLAGTASPADTAEYACLSGDIAALDAMLESAAQTVADLDPALVKQALHQAMLEHTREQDQLSFDALTAQAEQLDAALCQCGKQLFQYGQKLGRVSLLMCWTPSQKLAEAIKYGRVPT